MIWWPGLTIFLMISLPWHVAAYIKTPEFAHFYFVVQHFGRLVGDEHVKPFWFFFAVFPFIMLPWGVFLFPIAWNVIRWSMRAIRRLSQPFQANNPFKIPSFTLKIDLQQCQKTEPFLFLAIWIFVVIGLFSISRGKLVPYILPACPALALLLADYLGKEERPQTSTRWCVAVLALIFFALVPIVYYIARDDYTLPLSQMTFLIKISQAVFFIGGFFLILSICNDRLILGAVGFSFLLILPPIAIGTMSIVKYTKIGTIAKALPHPLPSQINIVEWKTYNRSLSFYTQRRMILVDEVSEISFGKNLDKHDAFFLKGSQSILQLAQKGPLLLNLKQTDWPSVAPWGVLRIVAANNKYILVGNEAFFHLTGLTPWPEVSIQSPPLLLLPKADP
jgi:hypothetical protein